MWSDWVTSRCIEARATEYRLHTYTLIVFGPSLIEEGQAMPRHSCRCFTNQAVGGLMRQIRRGKARMEGSIWSSFCDGCVPSHTHTYSGMSSKRWVRTWTTIPPHYGAVSLKILRLGPDDDGGAWWWRPGSVLITGIVKFIWLQLWEYVPLYGPGPLEPRATPVSAWPLSFASSQIWRVCVGYMS